MTRHFILLAFALAPCLLYAPRPSSAQDVEVAVETLAAAVRQRGHVCEDPKTVVHDPQNSEPDRKAWIIDCGNASYRVKFMGDTGPQVVRVD